MPGHPARLLPWLVVALHAAAGAQTVGLNGSIGDKALLVIDGQPRTVAVGSTVQGVKLLRLSNGEALVEPRERSLLTRDRRDKQKPAHPVRDQQHERRPDPRQQHVGTAEP